MDHRLIVECRQVSMLLSDTVDGLANGFSCYRNMAGKPKLRINI